MKRLALIGAIALLAGCGVLRPVGPDYHAPATPAARLPLDDNHAFADSMPPGPWWQLYQDAAVNTLVEEALRNNRDLRQSAARLEQAEGALDASSAAGLPQTSLSLQGQRSRGEVSGLTGLHETNAFSDSLQVSYELDLFGRIRRGIEAADASVEQLRAAYAAAQIQLVADTVRAYAQACQARAQLDTSAQTLALDRHLLALTQRQAAVGAVGASDVSRAEAQLATSEATLPPLQGQHSSALYSLAVLLGRQPDQAPAAAARCAAAPQVQRTLPIGNAAALLRRRPDIAQAERALAAATAKIGVATAELYPDISLAASLGGAGETPDALRRKTGRTWSLGPLISWTFPNQSAARAQIRQANAAADEALAAFDAAVLNALKETDTALTSYARELDHLQALQAARDADQRALEQQQRLYSAGGADLPSLLDSQRVLIQAQQQIVSSQGSLASDQVAVFLALGGGWADAAQRAAEGEAASAADRHRRAITK